MLIRPMPRVRAERRSQCEEAVRERAVRTHRAVSRPHAGYACARRSDGTRALGLVLTGAVELSPPPRLLAAAGIEKEGKDPS